MGVSIAVVGCGTVGATMVAALPARTGAGRHELVLVDGPTDRWRGRAYQRDMPDVLANGPMVGMSLHADDPEHGVRWATARGLAVLPDAAGTHRFLPRPVFGDYLEDGVAEALALLRAAGWRVRRIDEPAIALGRDARGITVATRRHAVRVDHAVLCVGGRPAADAYNLAGAPGYLGNPYPLRDALAEVPADRDVTVLGSGMTATDVVVALVARGHRGRITLASRSGLLPSVRRTVARVTLRQLTPDRLASRAGLELADVVAMARAEVGAAGDLDALAREVFSPPPALERLRRQLRDIHSPDIAPQVLQRAVIESGQDVWLALSDAARDAVLREHHAALWSFASPIPRSTGEILDQLARAGRLRVVADLAGVGRAAGGFTLHHGTRREHADLVIDAITAASRADPGPAAALVRAGCAAGVLSAHPHGGVRINPATGRVLDATGKADPRIHALGELTRGTYYFVSAVAAFTRRAADIATDIGGAGRSQAA